MADDSYCARITSGDGEGQLQVIRMQGGYRWRRGDLVSEGHGIVLQGLQQGFDGEGADIVDITEEVAPAATLLGAGQCHGVAPVSGLVVGTGLLQPGWQMLAQGVQGLDRGCRQVEEKSPRVGEIGIQRLPGAEGLGGGQAQMTKLFQLAIEDHCALVLKDIAVRFVALDQDVIGHILFTQALPEGLDQRIRGRKYFNAPTRAAQQHGRLAVDCPVAPVPGPAGWHSVRRS